jgi:membrane fusion protein, multidrug efflux system
MEAPRVPTLILLLIALGLPACNASGPQPQNDAKKITVVGVQSKSATIKQPYKCRIESYGPAEVRTEADGQLAAILVKEGQAVKRGDLLFQVGPPMDKEKREAENHDKAVSIKAPCDSFVGHLPCQQGSLVKKYDLLTILSDSSKMSVYFGVPEIHYLDYYANMHNRGEDPRSLELELILADHSKYPHAGKIISILGTFHNVTDDIPFRAEFPNPDRLLRHGQTGTLFIKWVVKNAIIPRRATFEDHAMRCVYVVDKNHVAHRREIVVRDEAEDPFVVKEGVGVSDEIVLEGVRQVRDGDKVE